MDINKRWKHVFSCASTDYGRKNNYSQFCFHCNEWMTSKLHWENHLQAHLNSLDVPTRCNPVVFRHAIACAGYCPVHLGDINLTPTERMKQFLWVGPWEKHISECIPAYVQEFHDQIPCPHPICSHFFNDRQIFLDHLADVHSVQLEINKLDSRSTMKPKVNLPLRFRFSKEPDQKNKELDNSSRPTKKRRQFSESFALHAANSGSHSPNIESRPESPHILPVGQCNTTEHDLQFEVAISSPENIRKDLATSRSAINREKFIDPRLWEDTTSLRVKDRGQKPEVERLWHRQSDTSEIYSLKSNHPPLSPTVELERGLERIAYQATSITTSDTAPGSMMDLEASNSEEKNSQFVQDPKEALLPTLDLENTTHSSGDQHDLDDTYRVQDLVEMYKDRNRTLFLVRWANGGTTWEPEENINDTQLIDDIIKDYQGFKNGVEVEKTRVKNGKLEYYVRFKDYIGSEKDSCWWVSENTVHPDNRKRGVRQNRRKRKRA